MAAPKENLLSLGHLIGMERNAFKNQREDSLKKSVNRPMLLQTDFPNLQSHQHPVTCSSTMHLLQRWQELKDRELRAQQHNKQLLQQFEEAQDTLREMLTLTAAMKTIRMEYERYLEESSPHRQQQLKTQAAQRKPFQLHHLGSMPSHHHPWPRQNPTGQASLHRDYACSAGAAAIPSGSEVPWVQLYAQGPRTERGVPQFVGEEASSAPSSKSERGGRRRSSRLSQELDTKPVRLSSYPAESSESSRESSQVSRETRKNREKRGRSRRTSSDRERRSSQDSSKNSSVIVTAAVRLAQSSESGVSSEEGRTSTWGRKSAEVAVGLQRIEKAVKERTRNKNSDSGSHKEESQSSGEDSSSEKAGDQSHDNSEGCREESGPQREEKSGSGSTKIKNGGGDLSSSSEESSGEKEHEKYLGEGDEDIDSDDNQDSKTDEQEERDVEDDVSEGNNTTEEEEETGAEEEMEEQESEEECDQEEKSDRLKNERQGSASSQDEEVEEDECEAGDDKMEEDGESDLGGVKIGGEEQQRDEAGQAEESDSEDSIISPQSKSKKLHVIPEEAREDNEDEEEGSQPGNSDEDSNEFSDDDIEHLLAPQEQSQKKEEKDLKAGEKPKAFCDKVEIFQVETERSTETDHASDSEEFDHFYD